MKNIHVDVKAYKGTYADIGYRQGRYLKHTPLVRYHYNERLKRSLAKYDVPVEDVKKLYQLYVPGLWEELKGLAEGLEWTFRDVLQEFSGYQASKVRSGCSGLMANGMYIRNYDYLPSTYEGRFLFTKPTGGPGTAGFAQRIIGRSDAMNEYGLSVGYHFVHRIKPKPGIVCSNLLRIVLETCRTTKEAVRLLQELPHRHSFNYSMMDASGEGAVVEASPRGTAVRPAGEVACTNHFNVPSMQQENRHLMGNSREREAHIRSIDWNRETVYSAFRRFNHDTDMIYSNDYEHWSGTIHTAQYLPAEKNIYVGIGGNRYPALLPFASWLNAEPMRITKIRGAVDTEMPFSFEW
ncbi:hypothetical protein CHL76_05375 [Marinococcus halophilus]|uniref:Choloylglycine hydrolase n=1 Tax=Marinococcus halophilus TaxID=1371 RepID=A0A510Y3A3_MARHA|nr:C45 family peptidase [Marinococcus halophilus]OZT80759.1 hypothetical protein CHL76_05375 [Marinococcus halophilus]GEK57810.1 choloylglycine hydrolase [Marinococcus halophilus]